VAADGAPRSPGGASHVTSAFGAEDEWGYPHPSTHRTRAGGPGPRTGPAMALAHDDYSHWCRQARLHHIGAILGAGFGGLWRLSSVPFVVT